MASSQRVLVVDDDPKVREVHVRLVKALGYEAETAADGLEALAKLPLGVDLVLVDGQMPHMDGFEVARRIRQQPEHAFLPIIMVTGLDRASQHRRALESGINDFITKPVDLDELQLRSRWLLELKQAHDRLSDHSEELREAVEERTEALRRALEATTDAQRRTYAAHLDTIRRLTVAAEFKDKDTGGHIERIGLYAEVMYRAMNATPGETEMIRHAAPMHDVGKLGIPDRILLKPGALDESELEIIRTHTTLGADILSGSDSAVIKMGETIALTHHERWDGKGYPRGLGGKEIPRMGRVCAIVDYFDALTMDRPYRPAVPVERVLEMMREESARHFDPSILDVFFGCVDEIQAIRHELGPRAS